MSCRTCLPQNVVLAAVDFETQSLRDTLEATDFAMNQRAVVSWIGVTMYVVREAINATLESVASFAPGTRIVVSFDQPPDVLDEKGRALSPMLAAPRRGSASRSSASSAVMRSSECSSTMASAA